MIGHGTPAYDVVGNRIDYTWALVMVAALWDGPKWIMDPATTLENAIGFNEIFCPMMVTVRWIS